MYDDDDLEVRPHLPMQVSPEHAPARAITVNGTRFTIHAEQIDHDQLVQLAYPDPARRGGTGTSMTVAYRGGPSSAPFGLLAPSERTRIADGESFVVTRTDKS